MAVPSKSKRTVKSPKVSVLSKLKYAELQPSYNRVSLFAIPLERQIVLLDEKLPAYKKTHESRLESEPSAIASLIWYVSPHCTTTFA